MSENTVIPNILVIGEVCEDVNVVCKVERICPEAPVPVHVPISSTSALGMAANTSNNLVSLGANTIYLFPLHTIKKIRHVDQSSGYILVRIDIGDEVPANPAFSRDDFDYLVIKEKIQGIVLSDYNKGYLTTDDIAYIAAYAKGKGIPVFLDTKKILGEWSRDITFVKINSKEYKQQCSSHSCPESLCENMIVTLGDNGSKWVNQDKIVPVEPVSSVLDVTGAGDTFHAAFAIEYIRSKDVLKAMDYANRAARIAVSRRGVVAIQASEVI